MTDRENFDYYLAEWLGDVYETLTPDQFATFSDAARRIEARYPDNGDYMDEQTDALSAALQVVLGESTPREVANAWTTARAHERMAMAALTGAICAALASGASEAGLAAETGVSRPTIRKATGK